jgi:hypothetical protein
MCRSHAMSARTRSVPAVIRLVSALPVLRIAVVGPDPRPVLLLRSSAGWARSSAGPLLLESLDPRVVREAAALRVRTPGLACCEAGWSPPGGRASPESVLAPCSMLAWPVSIELIDLPSCHLSHVTVEHPSRMGRLALNLIVTSSQVTNLIVTSSQVTVSPSSPVTQSGNSTSFNEAPCQT